MAYQPQRLMLAATVASVLALAGGLAVYHGQARAVAAPAGAAVPEVTVATVAARPFTPWQYYSGRLEAVDQVEIRPQVSGILTAVHFRDGARVRKGDPLFTIDPRPFAAEVSRAEAQLAAAEARVGYTASDLARGERLRADNAIAQRDFEEKQNAAREASANLAAARAALEVARLNLAYTHITAPISGRISRAEVTVGNLVAPGNAQALTTLVSDDTLYAAFQVDEQSYLKAVAGATVAGSTKGAPGLPVFMGLADEPELARPGRLASVDNRLDARSGTIRLRALFDNRDGRLVPGLFARVRLGTATAGEALLIDEKAIGTDQDKRFVLVVGEDHKAQYREVVLGAGEGSERVVSQGLKAGDQIVVGGLSRVRPGDLVSPQTAAARPASQQ